jgi:hypothetical protein
MILFLHFFHGLRVSFLIVFKEKSQRHYKIFLRLKVQTRKLRPKDSPWGEGRGNMEGPLMALVLGDTTG